MTAVSWDVKSECHNNLVLLHTRSDNVRDWLEDNTEAKRSIGTAYVTDAERVETIKRALQAAGFVVG